MWPQTSSPQITREPVSDAEPPAPPGPAESGSVFHQGPQALAHRENGTPAPCVQLQLLHLLRTSTAVPLSHVSVYVCMRACMHILTGKKACFLTATETHCSEWIKHVTSNTKRALGGWWRSICSDLGDIKSLVSPGKQSRRGSPPPPTKEPVCMAKPQNPCPLKESLYLLNERWHLSAVLLGKLDPNLLNLLKSSFPFCREITLPSAFLPSLHSSSNRSPQAL